MARVRLVLDSEQRFVGVLFECPGCSQGHMTPVDWCPTGTQPSPHAAGRARWGFNGKLELPTLSPSILMRTGHHAPGHTGACWCTWNEQHPEPEDSAPFTCLICHSFVRDGRIQFLGDCTHALAGQTVDLPEVG